MKKNRSREEAPPLIGTRYGKERFSFSEEIVEMRYKVPKQGRIHGSISRVRVGRVRGRGSMVAGQGQ